jgi:imidazoleglycerol phosphate synthase glutamine amidotransferase subunit HisH
MGTQFHPEKSGAAGRRILEISSVSRHAEKR